MKNRKSPTIRRNEAGMSLLVVLIALLIIGFAAVALLRSSDTGTLVAGNLAFQKTALASGDAARETAITWLGANGGGNTLFSDIPASGYYATSADNCDLTGTRTPGDVRDDVSWTPPNAATTTCNMDAITVTPAGVAPGFTVRYVINRVCNATGNPNALFAADGVTPMTCSTFASGASEDSTRIGASYGNTPLTGLSQTYYRVTTRIDGPRNTVRYVQALVVL
jgi:type IV pilus assembly protein PilX